MNEKAKNRVAGWSAASLAVASAVCAWRLGVQAALGVAAGGIWNLASLWCLTRMLHAWIGPNASQKRAVFWVLIKFPLLYSAIFILFHKRLVPLAAFSVGFSIVLLIAMAVFVSSLRRPLGELKT